MKDIKSLIAAEIYDNVPYIDLAAQVWNENKAQLANLMPNALKGRFDMPSALKGRFDMPNVRQGRFDIAPDYRKEVCVMEVFLTEEEKHGKLMKDHGTETEDTVKTNDDKIYETYPSEGFFDNLFVGLIMLSPVIIVVAIIALLVYCAKMDNLIGLLANIIILILVSIAFFGPIIYNHRHSYQKRIPPYGYHLDDDRINQDLVNHGKSYVKDKLSSGAYDVSDTVPDKFGEYYQGPRSVEYAQYLDKCTREKYSVENMNKMFTGATSENAAGDGTKGEN